MPGSRRLYPEISMLTFVFWNTYRRSLTELVSSLAAEHNADLVILAESDGEPAELLDALNLDSDFPFYYVPTLARKLKIFCRFSPDFLRPKLDTPRSSIWSLMLPARPDLIIAAVHLPSKKFLTPNDQIFECTRLSEDIRNVEAELGHSRSILAGDLNMNPFEFGMVAADGLNATMDRKIALRGSRVVQGKRLPFFYNPMWGFMHDEGREVCGTYYFDTGRHENYYWNVFDQAMIRPDLLRYLPEKPVNVVTEIRARSLLSINGRPDKNTVSDHLPLVLRLDL